MPRPAVLLFEPDADRRKALAHGLSGCGYELTVCAALFQPTEEELPLVAPLEESA